MLPMLPWFACTIEDVCTDRVLDPVLAPSRFQIHKYPWTDIGSISAAIALIAPLEFDLLSTTSWEKVMCLIIKYLKTYARN